MDSYNISIGNLIKEKRIQKGLTTQQLASDLNVSTGFINNLENAKTDAFNTNLVATLCKTLGMSPLNFLPEPNIDIDFDNIYQSDNLNQFPEANKKLIINNVTAIATAYIESIRLHSYDVGFINKFTNKILSEIDYIDNFKLK